MSSCADTSEEAESLEIQMDDNDQEHHKGCDDGCSSICICTGCSNILINQHADLEEAESPYVKIANNPQFYSALHDFLIPIDIWQPPKG